MSLPRPGLRGLMAVLLVAACKGKAEHSLSASSYDRSCGSGFDCTPVFEGDLTDCPSDRDCPNAAITTKGFPDYAEDATAQMRHCPPAPISVCPSIAVLCPMGQCQVQRYDVRVGYSAVLSAADYDQSCTDPADCMAVYLGPIDCCDSVCANAAINVASRPQYLSDTSARNPHCFPPPQCPPDPICTAGRINCLEGKCVLLIPPPSAPRDAGAHD